MTSVHLHQQSSNVKGLLLFAATLLSFHHPCLLAIRPGSQLTKTEGVYMFIIINQESENSVFFSTLWFMLQHRNSSGAEPENLERVGRVPSFPPPPPPLERKLHFSGHAAYSIVGVFVMQSKVTFRKTEHFIKRFSKQNHSVSGRKKGGRGPLGPFPKSAYAGFWQTVYQKNITNDWMQENHTTSN